MTDLDKERSRQLLLLFVQDALSAQISGGDSSSYESLVQELELLKKGILETGDAVGVQQYNEVVVVVTSCVSALNEAMHQRLLHEVMDFRPWSFPQPMRMAVLDLLLNLVLAKGQLAHHCFSSLLYNLLPPPTPPGPEAAATLGQPWIPDQHAVEVQDEIVNTLHKIVCLVPTAPSHMLPIIRSNMPHKSRDRTTQCLYLRALFSLAEGAAGIALREAILAAVVDHLVSVDVEIRWEDIVDEVTEEIYEEGSSSDEDQADDIFELEGLAQGLELDSPAKDGPTPTPRNRGGWEGAAASNAKTQQKPSLDETADKLDSMMELTFAHLDVRCTNGDTRVLWNTLLAAFEETLLNVPRSKFSQFLLFFVAQRDAEWCGGSLVKLLLGKLVDPRQASITRCACAAYLASFLARAAFVSEELTVEALEQLARWALQYCQSQSTRQAPVNTLTSRPKLLMSHFGDTGDATHQKHQVLYAIVQAMLYVLCYHLKALMKPEKKGVSANTAAALVQRVSSLITSTLPQILSHPLAPLGACAPTVVREFSRQVQTLGLLDCSPFPGQASDSARGSKEHRPLEMFFPFDPYLLKRSSRYLNLLSSYVCWAHGHPKNTSRAGACPREGSGSEAEDHSTSGSDSDTDEHRIQPQTGQSSESDSDDSGSDSEDSDSDEVAELARRPSAPQPLLRGGSSVLQPISMCRPMATSYDTVGGMTPSSGASPPLYGTSVPMMPCSLETMPMTRTHDMQHA